MDQKQNTNTLDNSELQRLMDLSECAMIIARQQPEFTIKYANEKFYDMLKYTAEEFKEIHHNHLMAVALPEETQKIRALVARQSAAGGDLHLEFRVRRKDGAILWLSMTAHMEIVDGQTIYFCSCMNITQQKRNLEDIYNAKREIDLITNNIPGGVIKLRLSDYILLYANDGFYRLAGYSRAEYLSLFGNQCTRVIHPDDAETVNRLIRSAVDNRGTLSFEYRIIAKNGEIRWSYVNGCRMDDQDGEVVYLCIITDITARKKLEEKFEENLHRTQYLLDYMKETEWTYVISKKKLYRSGYLEGTYSPKKEMDHPFENQFIENIIHAEDIKKFRKKLEERMETSGNSKGIYRIKDRSGNFRPCEISMISIGFGEGNEPEKIYGETRILDDHSFIVENSKTLGERKEAVAEKVLEMATTAQAKKQDTITGLMPYDVFLETAQDLLDVREEGENYGILCCDINEFSKINYHYGISIGNEILKKLGEILQEELAYQKLCSRVDGDYFVLFFEYQDYKSLLAKMSHILRKMTEMDAAQNYSTYGTTIGIYLMQEEDQEIDYMLEKADFARRSIKGIHGNHYAVYTEDMQKNQFWEEEVIRDIGSSMLNHTVEVCYLPRIRESKENVIGCKAMPRIQLKNGSYLQLEDLRRYVDRSEDIQQLVFYVLDTVCINQGAWKSSGRKIMPVSIDITPSQLCMQNAVAKINEIVNKNKLTSSDIIFEIQEQYFKGLSNNFHMALEDLKSSGYRVMISRFGSDHTAIHSLRQYPISGIKFHGEFFHKNMTSEKEQVVLCKIVEMIKELGLSVGCGGIHTQLQEDLARSIGCDIFEGDMYYGSLSNDVYEKCFLN